MPCVPQFIVSENKHTSFSAVGALTDCSCDSRYNYWMGPVHLENAEFVIDLGCIRRVTEIVLRNGHGVHENT